MDATAWTVIGAAIAIVVAIATSFRSLRGEMRAQKNEMRAQIRAQGKEMRTMGEDLRKRIDAQSEQIGLLRERMAHLEGLLEGLREAITRRAA